MSNTKWFLDKFYNDPEFRKEHLESLKFASKKAPLIAPRRVRPKKKKFEAPEESKRLFEELNGRKYQ